MKTRKKLLIALLSATCLTAGAFGMVACGSADPQPDPTLYAIYNKYVADNPDSAKTYEEWLSEKLEIIAKPGQPGEPGKDGKDAYELYIESLPPDAIQPSREQWLASLVGQAGAAGVTPHIGENGNWYLGDTDTGVKAQGHDGVGIENVTMSDDGKKLLITLTGTDEPVEVVLPDSMTHEHTQSTEYKVLIAPTPESEGLGYTECTSGDGHIELVVIPTYSYKINVSLPETSMEGENGFTPFEGATVTLKDGEEVVASATTDVNGDVFFNDIEKKVYTYEVTADGYHVVYGGEDLYAENKTDEFTTDYVAILIKESASGNGSAESPYAVSASFEKKGDISYSYFVPTKAKKYGYDLNTDVYFTFTAPKSGSYMLAEMNQLDFTAVKGTYSNGMLLLNEGEQAVVAVKTDDTLYDFVVVVVGFIEEMKPGTQNLPKVFEAGKEFTVSSSEADKDGYVYLNFTSDFDKYTFTSSADSLELSYYAFDSWSWSWSWNEVNFEETVKDVGIKKQNPVTLFKAKLPSGVDSVTLNVELYRAPGEEAENAVNLVFDTVTKPHTDLLNEMSQNYRAWYKYVVTADMAGLVTLDFSSSDSFAIYSEDAHGEEDPALVYASGAYPFNFKEGTYYIKVTVGGVEGDSGKTEPGSFKVRAYNEETDKGLSKYAPLTVELDTATDVQYNYFKFTASEDGFYMIDGRCVVYSDAEFETKVNVVNDMLELAANQTVYFSMHQNYSNYPNYYALTVTKVSDEMQSTPVKYSFVVKDANNNGIADVTVTVNGESGKTDAAGKVELTLVPGEYEVNLDFGDNAGTYVYDTKVTTAKVFKDTETTLNVAMYKQMSVMVVDYETYGGIAGVEVSVWTQVQGDKGTEGEEPVWEQVGEAKTTAGNMGVANFTLLSNKNYRFKLANVPEEYEFDEFYTSANIQLRKKSDVPDNPNPDVEKKYLYTGWKDEIVGEQAYKLFTADKVASVTITVHGGYIKNLVAINDEYGDTAYVVKDGNLEEDNNGTWTGEVSEGSFFTVILNGSSYTLSSESGIEIELEICSFNDTPAYVTIQKVIAD